MRRREGEKKRTQHTKFRMAPNCLLHFGSDTAALFQIPVDILFIFMNLFVMPFTLNTEGDRIQYSPSFLSLTSVRPTMSVSYWKATRNKKENPGEGGLPQEHEPIRHVWPAIWMRISRKHASVIKNKLLFPTLHKWEYIRRERERHRKKAWESDLMPQSFISTQRLFSVT